MSFYDLDENSPIIKHPKGLKVKLRPHQLTSICAMKELENQGTIVIDRPAIDSGLCNTLKHKINLDELTESTFIVETNSAILADKVGSGKTYMIIGLILHKQIPVSHDRFMLGTNHFSIKMINGKEAEGMNLIVVPHNLANQWETFMEKSTLKYLIINKQSDLDVFYDIDYVDRIDYGDNHFEAAITHTRSRKKNVKVKRLGAGSKTAKTRMCTAGEIFYERRILSKKKTRRISRDTQVIVLNINRYKAFKQIFRSVKWARVIIDEMDSANIPASFDEFGNFNWFLTATPTSIFYKSCRNYVNKIFGYHQHLLQYFVVKNKDEYVDTSIILPKPYVFMINTMLHKVVSAIQDLIPQDVLHLINAGNMKEAVAKLNCDVDTEENIVKVLTDKINTEKFNLKKELKYVKSLIPVDVDAHQKRVDKLKAEIERCNVKLETIIERVSSIKKEYCFICTESYDTPTILDCCKNVFCLKCLLSALKNGDNKCPYCRHVLKSNKEYHIISASGKKSRRPKKEKKDDNEKTFDCLDKCDVLEKILMYIAKNDESPKILIFSDYPQTFDKIVNNIAKAELQYSMLSGIPSHITNVINEFKAGITNILMLDSKHYGSGLNLQDANYLILYHRMTPELETQVIGRAQRFGRTTPLKVIYLINSSESDVTKLTSTPTILDAESKLWLLTNPIENESTSSSSDESNKDTKTKKKATNNSDDTKAKKKDIDTDNSDDAESDEDNINNSNDAESEEETKPINKKGKKHDDAKSEEATKPINKKGKKHDDEKSEEATKPINKKGKKHDDAESEEDNNPINKKSKGKKHDNVESDAQSIEETTPKHKKHRKHMVTDDVESDVESIEETTPKHKKHRKHKKHMATDDSELSSDILDILVVKNKKKKKRRIIEV